MNNSYALIITILLCISCSSPETKNTDEVKIEKTVDTPKQPTFTEVDKGDLSIKVFEASEGTFGYDILKKDKVYIHQPHIPGVQGTKGFKTQQQAQIAAELIVFKITNNIVPPTVSQQELDSLNLLD